MPLPRLLDVAEAAAAINVPVKSLESAAEKFGYLYRIGRSKRLHPDEIEELLLRCRKDPKDRACTGEKGPTVKASGKSGTPKTDVESANRPARQSAQKLKSRSKTTSPENAGEVVRLHRRK